MRVDNVIAWRMALNHSGASLHPSIIDKDRLKSVLEGRGGTVVGVDSCMVNAFLPGEIDVDVLIRRGLA